MTYALISLVVLGLFCSPARGQGRAFPIKAEENTIARFQTINPRLKYDVTNYLIDLAGQYAGCFNLREGFEVVDNETPDHESIQGIVGITTGRKTHVHAVTDYIDQVVEKWMNNDEYRQQIRAATKFGCSVRPGCGGRVSVACLFSPSRDGPGNIQRTDSPGIQEKPWVANGVAFTREQYSVAEFTHVWDLSHLLENLSGYETNCDMVEAENWPWTYLRVKAEERELTLTGHFGATINRGNTEAALRKILADFKDIRATAVGCSLIPDCTFDGDDNMYVVVSCIYKDEGEE